MKEVLRPMRSRKKNRNDHHTDESWLIPYADILTLLLALFIVLFALSSIDAQKFERLARAFNSNFDGGASVLEYPSPLPQQEMENIEENKQNGKVQNEPHDNDESGNSDQEELAEVQNRFNQYIEENNLKNNIKTSLNEEGLLITIRDDILFDSGSAKVRKKDEILATDIAKMLAMGSARNVVISGHTDNVPIHNSNFDSNWHLSVMRAVNVMKIILENKNLDPSKFSAKGYGEYKPVASNDTAEGRQKNRRVEILILPNNKKAEPN